MSDYAWNRSRETDPRRYKSPYLPDAYVIYVGGSPMISRRCAKHRIQYVGQPDCPVCVKEQGLP